jgi:uncharacterized small protein (DUF1192 family)
VTTLLAARIFDPDVFVGVLGVVTLPLSIVLLAWGVHKTQSEKAWRSAAEAADEGFKVMDARVRGCNEELARQETRAEEKAKALVAVHEEKERAIAILTERIEVAEAERIRLLERSPEKLWEVVSAGVQALGQHVEDADRHWAVERPILQKLSEFLEAEGKSEP